MRRLGKALVIGTTAIVVAAAGTVFAYAGGWTLPDGNGAYTARVAKMPRGVTPSAAKQNGNTAVVTWSAQEIDPGVRMDKYVVTAHSLSEPPTADVAHTATATGETSESVTFTAAELAGGKWQWTIIPKFRTWTGVESAPSKPAIKFPAAPAAARSVSPAPAVDAAATPSAAPVVSPKPTTTTAPIPAKQEPVEDAPASPAAEPATSSPEPPESSPVPSASASGESTPPPAG